MSGQCIDLNIPCCNSKSPSLFCVQNFDCFAQSWEKWMRFELQRVFVLVFELIFLFDYFFCNQKQKVAISYDQFYMTKQVICKLTNLYFEDDHWLLNLNLLLNLQNHISAIGQDRTPSLSLHCLRRLPNLASSQGLIEYYTNISNVKIHKEIGHLTKYLVCHLKMVTLKNLNLEEGNKKQINKPPVQTINYFKYKVSNITRNLDFLGKIISDDLKENWTTSGLYKSQLHERERSLNKSVL